MELLKEIPRDIYYSLSVLFLLLLFFFLFLPPASNLSNSILACSFLKAKVSSIFDSSFMAPWALGRIILNVCSFLGWYSVSHVAHESIFLIKIQDKKNHERRKQRKNLQISVAYKFRCCILCVKYDGSVLYVSAPWIQGFIYKTTMPSNFCYDPSSLTPAAWSCYSFSFELKWKNGK